MLIFCQSNFEQSLRRRPVRAAECSKFGGENFGRAFGDARKGSRICRIFLSPSDKIWAEPSAKPVRAI